MKSLFALDTPHSLKFTMQANGKIISLTNALSEIIYFSTANTNIHQLLLNSSNYNDECRVNVTKLINKQAPAISILLKFNQLTTLAILSITRLELPEPVLYGVITPVKLPLYSQLLFRPKSHLVTVNRSQSVAQLPMYKLNDKEQAVVYLMCIGLTQREIANFLGFTRGYIATLIAYGICPKFGLVNSSSRRVVASALEIKLFDEFIPTLVADKLEPLIL